MAKEILAKEKNGLRTAVIFFLLYYTVSAFAQEKITITGVVLDSTDRHPLSLVTVKVEGTDVATQTDNNGQFTIVASPDGVLMFNNLGYAPQRVSINGRNQINVSLTVVNENLSEVVVVGYGTQKKLSVTGAVSTVQNKELRQNSSASLASALAGRLPGLTSLQGGGGQPGRDDPTLYLRGAATTNNTSPLILIDGVPRDNIRTLDANEVESVTVLKDASATAVFGVRGANGVILITTRRGSEGKTELTATLDQSYTSFTREPERLHSLEYLALRNEAARNDGITEPFGQDVINKFENPLLGLDPNDPAYEEKAMIRRYIYPDHDYYRELIAKHSPQTRVNLNAHGGTDKVSFFVNGAFLYQGGNLKTEPEPVLGYDPSSWLKRYNFRANLDYKISPALKSFLNIGSYIEQVNMPAAWQYGHNTDWMMTDILFQAQSILPITPGPTAIPGFGVEPGQLVDPGYLDRSAFEIMNRHGFRNEMRSNLNTTLGLDWDLSNAITQGLSVKGMVSYDTRATTAMSGDKHERLYLANVNYATDELSYTVLRNDERLLSITKGADSRYNINLQGSINYQRTFQEKHDVTGMILAQRDNWESTVGEIPFNVIGIAARTTYAYDGRYLGEVNIGYNGSEQFAPGRRFGFFPAVSLGWVVSNENFLKNHKLIDNLKLRGSYGKVGNDRLGAARFLYQSNITMGGGPLGSLGRGQGVNQGLLGNPNLSWEVAQKQNYGIDLQLVNDFTLVFDYFIENRTDVLIDRQTIPVLQGVPLGNIPKVNMGVIDNKGYEIELTYNKTFGQDFSLMVTGNYGYNRNEIQFLDEVRRDETFVYPYQSTYQPIGQAWGYHIDYSNGNGIFNSQEELDAYLNNTTYNFGQPRIGDFIYQDLNGDGIVDDRDQAPIGYSNIPRQTYGLNLSMSYKSFDFSVFFQGAGKFSQNYAEQGVYESTKNGTYFGYHKNAWTPERYANGDLITYPALSTRNTTNHVANDFFVMDRSFIRLRYIELAYTLPKQALQSLGVNNLRIYASAQNLFTWDKLRLNHLDPENNNALGYPVTKMINFGLQLSF
ncbi:TonB-dependent receptor [Olivibacter sp. SDN3]|uniref:SusC/RagA family TonB-linked outer membrane protein n=1 Tax=Olivibacter sp. SDN3 TaxID=2764720 RepID=UPI0016514DCD|nr:TonB-dependent receptor [Olivibacter sp. SDN3]QNL50458.1 TonB-dependent receptor [Olivibacter sp. SDN3]